jgi:hypothetical protein
MSLAKSIAGVMLALLLPPPVPPEKQPVPLPNPTRDQLKTEKEKEAEKETEKEETPDPAYMTLLPDDGSPWGLKPELAAKLAEVAEKYSQYAVKFVCTESVRKATFSDGEAKKESHKKYGYLLERGDGQDLREYRQKMRSDGTVTDSQVTDAEGFPPSYEWVFLFSKANQPYFAYRERGDRFEGYDWVRIFEFKGAVPFTDGRDIRQWDGVALVDATTFTPVEIRVEPSRQQERLKLLFQRWAQSFNVIGYRTGPKPEGVSGRVVFQTRRDGLTFPTELRYTTFKAISPKHTVSIAASTREYSGYHFFETQTKEKLESPSH